MNATDKPGPAPSPWAQKAARDLGVDEVLRRIAHYAFNVETRTRLVATKPFSSRTDAEREHAWVREALVLTQLGCSLPIRQTNSVAAAIESLHAGAVLSGALLFDCRVCLEQALQLRQHSAQNAEACAALARALVLQDQASSLVDALRRAVDEGGQLFDHASDGLRAARTELARARELVRQEQADLIRKYKTQLSGTYFAEREGRFVLPLRSDAERIEGTILGSSVSGSTLYVEPQELTKHNNRLRLAEAREHQEEETVLAQLSALLRAHSSVLVQASENCLLGDRIAAVAQWATRAEALPTEFVDEPVLRLDRMRHPLLISTEASSPSIAVTNDLELRPGCALVLSGPNAGGKTVALTCLGLAVWMSKSGLPVPCAESSHIGWFRDVFTDIGDDQSIARSLSTFSSHIVHLSHCIDSATKGVLILIDEVAGGTDPEEGAALAEATLRTLVQTQASVAVTTHYPRLKQLAAKDTETFCNGSVGFDLDTMQPTFRVTLGIPGVSSALAVAARFGIPESVVASARALLPKEHVTEQHLLQRISQELDKATANRDATDSVLQETQRKAGALEAEHQRSLQTDRMALEKLRAELTHEVKQARADLLRAKGLLTLPTKETYREAELLVSQAALPITLDGSLTRALRTKVSTPAASQSETFAPGSIVHLSHLNTEGQVLEGPVKGHLRVSVGGLKMSVPIGQVQRAKPSAAPAKIHKPKRSAPAAPVTNYSGAMRTQRNTCDLRGKRVDQGLSDVDTFLDQMLQLHEPAAFLLHGHGTGAMKAAVREHLATSPIVRHFEPADQDNGGDAFTVVWLR